MPLVVKPLHTKEQTAREMGRLVDRYATDLHAFDVGGVSLADIPLPIFYRAIANIPYREDTEGIEVVTRPYLVLTAPRNGADCKKKHILIAAWLKLHNIPYRFVAVSRRPSGEIHHVIIEAYIDNEWVEIDATYPHNQLFQRQHWTNAELLSGSARPPSASPVLVSLSGDGAPGPALTYEYVSTMRRACPEYMGEGVGAVVTLVVAIITAVTATVVAIVNAVSAKREGERADKRQADSIASYAQIAASQAAATQEVATQQIAADAAKQAKQYEMIKKWILPASIAAGALILFR